MDFLCICALAINFFLSRLNLILDLNRLIDTLLLSQFQMCRVVSDAIKRDLAQLDIGVALKSHCMLSSDVRKPKDRIVESEKSGLVYETSCRDCDAVYIGEIGFSLKTRKREHFNAVKKMDVKQSALCLHIVDFDHFIALDEAKI